MAFKLNDFLINVNVLYMAAYNCSITSLPLGVTVTTVEEEMETNGPANFKNDLLSFTQADITWCSLNLLAHVLCDVTAIYFVALQMFASRKYAGMNNLDFKLYRKCFFEVVQQKSDCTSVIQSCQFL